MRQICETEGCRRDVYNVHFLNPLGSRRKYVFILYSRANYLTALGTSCGNCDNCIVKLQTDHLPLSTRQQHIIDLIKTINILLSDPPKETPSIKRRIRKNEHRQAILTALTAFRDEYWLRHYKRCSWGSEVLLPQKTIEFLATNAHVRTLNTLKIFYQAGCSAMPLPHWLLKGSRTRTRTGTKLKAPKIHGARYPKLWRRNEQSITQTGVKNVGGLARRRGWPPRKRRQDSSPRVRKHLSSS
jgi:hypothetical protein